MTDAALDFQALQSLLGDVRGLPVACAGDLMLDRYVHGEVSRISAEAPIPVLRSTRSVAMPGAVGNVARNLAALGGRVRLGGRVGEDGAGEELEGLLTAIDGVDCGLERSGDRPTIVKTRFVAAGQQLLRLDEETPGGPGLSGRDLFDEARAILISDYAKGAVGAELIEAALAAGRRTGAPVVVDPKGLDFARYGAVDVIKPNAGELAAAAGLPTGTDAEVEAALAALLERIEARAVVVTRAGKGMSWQVRGEAPRHLAGRAREVFDVSGAGDTALAALGLALGAGRSLDRAVRFALLASGVVVGKAGTAVVTPNELLQAEMSEHDRIGQAKVAAVGDLADQVQRWRDQGLKVGFTNGCFDILHSGHVAYLGQARGWCDRLVVALNTDASVRRLKGEGRPVNDLESRAAVIGGLSSVDAVTAFDEPTPLDLIARLRPDVLIKGADYARADVVGGDLVESWGGEVRLAEFRPGFSTTLTLERMAGTS